MKIFFLILYSFLFFLSALGEQFLFDYAASAPLLWFWSGSQFSVCRNVICSSNNSFGLIIILWTRLLLLAQLQLHSNSGFPPGAHAHAMPSKHCHSAAVIVTKAAHAIWLIFQNYTDMQSVNSFRETPPAALGTWH